MENKRLTLEEYIIQNKQKMIIHFDSSKLNELEHSRIETENQE